MSASITTSTKRRQCLAVTANTRVTFFRPATSPDLRAGNANGNVTIFNRQIAGGVTHIFNQNSILDARFAYTHTNGGKSPYGAGLASLMAGIPGLPTDPTVTRSLNVQSVNTFSQFGNQGSIRSSRTPRSTTRRQTIPASSGAAPTKRGYEYQAVYTAIDDFNPTYGQDTYNGNFSFVTGDSATTPGSNATALSASSTGLKEAVSLADFLVGARNTYQLNNFVIVHLNQRMHYLYLQDDIRCEFEVDRQRRTTLRVGDTPVGVKESVLRTTIPPEWHSSRPATVRSITGRWSTCRS